MILKLLMNTCIKPVNGEAEYDGEKGHLPGAMLIPVQELGFRTFNMTGGMIIWNGKYGKQDDYDTEK